MDEKPKIITKLEWLYLFSGVIFFLDAIFALIFLIAAVSLSGPIVDTELALTCLSIFFIDFIVCFCMGFFSLKIWNLMKKGNKSAIAKGLTLSIISFLIFIGPMTFLLWYSISTRIPPPSVSLENLLLILLYAFLFLTILLNFIVIAVSLTSQVSKYCKMPLNNK